MTPERTKNDIEDALQCISPDCSQDVWWRVAAAIYDALGDEGFDLFDAWSATARKPGMYPGRRACWRKWVNTRKYSKRWGNYNSDTRRPITVGTLFFYAETGGR
jgi:hypothetical protein